jgi:hypothetical protein
MSDSSISSSYNETCSIEGCDRIRDSKGLCKAHYMRKRYNSLIQNDPHIQPRRSKCSVDQCDRKHEARGFCKLHYDRSNNGIPLDQKIQVQIHGRSFCEVENCVNPYQGRGFCKKHLHLAKTYKMTAKQISNLPKACEICGSTDKLTIDHDHSCCSGGLSCGLCVRGVLCFRCNAGLGNFYDNVKNMTAALLYLTTREINPKNKK